jgi:hypothetical protein
MSSICRGHCFPGEMIARCVCFYFHISLSFRDRGDVRAERESLARGHPDWASDRRISIRWHLRQRWRSGDTLRPDVGKTEGNLLRRGVLLPILSPRMMLKIVAQA